MARSQRPRLRELRAIYRLLGECCELGADPLAWRRHMAEALPRLLGAQVGIYQELRPVEPHGRPGWLIPRLTVDTGWATDGDRRALVEFWGRGEHTLCPWFSPENARRVFFPAHGVATFDRDNLIEERDWYRSEFFNEYVRRAHLDAVLLATHCRTPGESHGIVLHRALGEAPFERRQRRLLGLFYGEHLRLIGAKLASRDAPSARDLPPRLRQVLAGLMEGESEKSLATRLEISRHTVHYHIKQLHQRFGASTRGELLARAFRSSRADD